MLVDTGQLSIKCLWTTVHKMFVDDLDTAQNFAAQNFTADRMFYKAQSYFYEHVVSSASHLSMK